MQTPQTSREKNNRVISPAELSELASDGISGAEGCGASMVKVKVRRGCSNGLGEAAELPARGPQETPCLWPCLGHVLLK